MRAVVAVTLELNSHYSTQSEVRSVVIHLAGCWAEYQDNSHIILT